MPKAYLVLASENSAQDFDQGLFLKRFPALNNSGDALLLKDKNAAIIDSVNYAESWYGNADKADGGWTLEIMTPTICSEHHTGRYQKIIGRNTRSLIQYREKPICTPQPDLSIRY